MNKKQVEKAQFDEGKQIEKDTNGKETTKVITDQKAIKWEVRLFYWKLYHKEERTSNKKEILRKPLKVKRVNDEDRARMSWKITQEKVGITLKRTRNNVAPGVGGFWGYFNKVKKAWPKMVCFVKIWWYKRQKNKSSKKWNLFF